MPATGDSLTKPVAICLMGPTASGKTALALELAAQRDVELISVDSAQVYRGMDIGSGKPDAETLARFPHQLMDIRDPAEAYSASEFRSDAIAVVCNALEKGRVPLLVGGTMLYFKVLRDGLATMPGADAQTRAEIEQVARDKGWQAVHDWLAQVDPEAARRIHPNDPQRLQRALEVYLVSGQTMTALHRQEKDRQEKDRQDKDRQEQASAQNTDNNLPFNLVFCAIQPQDRAVLHDNIAQRFRAMLAEGLLEEVRSLYGRDDLHENLPSIKSVGYRQVWQYLDGQLDYDAMVEKSIIATRQLAKRQLTWLRSWEDLTSLSDSQAQSTAKLLKYVDSAAI